MIPSPKANSWSLAVDRWSVNNLLLALEAPKYFATGVGGGELSQKGFQPKSPDAVEMSSEVTVVFCPCLHYTDQPLFSMKY